jgi:hypothetical protein
MKRVCFALLLLLLTPCLIEAQNKLQLNTGFKAGVQASTYQQTKFTLEGYSYNKKSLNTRIGYTFSGFLRLSKGRPYIQTEGIFSIDKYNFSFETESPTASSEEIIPRYKLTTYSVHVPLLAGYNFVNTNTYKMSVFTGPKANFLFTSLSKQEYWNFPFADAKEELDPLTFSWVLGLEVSIANICFDFIYQVGMNNTSKYIYVPETQERFLFNRNVDVLGLSLGVTL